TGSFRVERSRMAKIATPLDRVRPVKPRSWFPLATCLLALAAAAPAAARGVENPCEAPGARGLLCPNLRIGPPTGLYALYRGPGRIQLPATSDVRSRGRGPMELRGRRTGWRT